MRRKAKTSGTGRVGRIGNVGVCARKNRNIGSSDGNENDVSYICHFVILMTVLLQNQIYVLSYKNILQNAYVNDIIAEKKSTNQSIEKESIYGY